jgi:16S rRNA (cytidine1402-2'-O)-methyltransferase
LPAPLFIVATPIGNLGDISVRATAVLRDVAAIACEDTRQTAKLLQHLGISKPLLACHEHNERAQAAEIVARLLHGEAVALVSDAGTPLISDPGYRLIEAALAAGIQVIPIPGANAAVAALSASGLPTDAFYFGGFLAVKQGQRRKQLEDLRALPATLIFYEAPHRIVETLDDIQAVMGGRPVVLGRELTKMHEEFLRGTAAELRQELASRPAIKGEFTVLIGKGESGTGGEPQLSAEDAVKAMVEQGIGRMDAIKVVAKERGLSKRELYKLLNG